MSANPCLPSSSKSAAIPGARLIADRSTRFVLAFPYLELLAVGVAASLPLVRNGVVVPA